MPPIKKVPVPTTSKEQQPESQLEPITGEEQQPEPQLEPITGEEQQPEPQLEPITGEEQQPEPQLRNFYDFGFRSVGIEPKVGITGEPTNFTIVNTPGNGKRVAIAEDIYEEIGAPVNIQFLINDNGVCIGGGLPVDDLSFPVRRQGKKAIVYSYGLVNKLTDDFHLDFSGRTSISFQEIEYIVVDGVKAVYVSIKPEPQEALVSVEVVMADEEDGQSA